MILIVDNYDSFTYNLAQRIGEIDGQVDLKVMRNDQVTIEQIQSLAPTHLIISPGPCTPNEAGISVDCVKHFHGKLPILGVCLGHQSIGAATGSKIVRADRLMHGKTDQIHHVGKSIFAGIPTPTTATRYHSLVIQPDTLSDEFEVIAWTFSPDGEREIMGIKHQEHPTFGLQFHPESFLSERGVDMIKNFIEIGSPVV